MKFSKSLGRRALVLALGGTILLPAVNAFAAASYTATDNDTFWKLSKKFGVPLQTLMQANPKVNPLNIYQGLKLTIPSAAQAKPAGSGAAAAKAAASAAAANKVAANKVTASAVAAKSVTTSSGSILAYSKVIDMKATAYSASNEENGWGPVDYFGNPLKLGTIAVDPKVIPFGTKVYLTGYSFGGLPAGGMIATASDTGSAIVGNRVDIFVPGSRQQVAKFGFQQVKLYVLK
ncbi:hypothetical protein J19TS2_06600 [Cohnella xylanilytica]|uniref:LysM peptidoglycan-binding domain-containing protein n=1 Tax=Cohnella xylanilytica TaxID=557555 RepID=A0A841U1H1_9BACL|nr:3D domain-containing protein [Cohnella xylanilytica]MBB6691961.1 LysM peptidoglycan-binding domain-containing protein [Cohnella xylanilytica]GIO11105.1 hypothetical protein J19TS2_06600 [Cohnella xylanilytica]